jgi:dTDP-4-dehydrorhamnose 3,5-epimerase
MLIKKATVHDVFVCQLNRFCDNRGYFEELFSEKYLPSFTCRQINCSRSKKNVLRGLHIVPFAKLVHCVQGRIFDVVADMRKKSPTYLKWYGLELSEENQKSLYVPAHCAHGFLALDNVTVVYAQDGLYDPKLESSVMYNDSTLNIRWPGDKFIMSEKDMLAPSIKNA